MRRRGTWADALGGSFLAGGHRPGKRRVLEDGEPGELVLTTLTKEAMPVIRYRTRDLTRLLPGTAREHAPHRARDGTERRHAHHPRRQCLSVAGRSGADAGAGARAALPPGGQTRQERLDELEVHRRTARLGDRRRWRTSARRWNGAAEHLIKAHIGVTTKVRAVTPGTIERSQGKAKRVRDLRPKA